MSRRRLVRGTLVVLGVLPALRCGVRSRPVEAEPLPWAAPRVGASPIAPPRTAASPLAPEERAPTADEPDRAKVRCPVVMADPVEGTVELAISLASPTPGTTSFALTRADLRAGEVTFHDTPGSLRRGHVKVPGYLRTQIEWSPRPGGGFACPEVHLRQGAVVVGTVDPPPRKGWDGTVFVRGCGATERVAEDGSFYLEGTPEPCELRASRDDGWYEVQSEPVRVAPRLGDEVQVHLELPEALQSGLGARVEAADEGVRLVAVRTGSAAANAGLRPGDVVVSVDGTGVAGIDRDDFGALTKGDVGGTFVVEVLVDGVPERRVLTRTFVPSEDVRVEIPAGFAMRPDPEAWVR